jgi:uncharacterized protein
MTLAARMSAHNHSDITAATAECPCTGHCTTALGDDVCRSCHRTFDEVTRWLEFSDAERIQINRRIAQEKRRLSTLNFN